MIAHNPLHRSGQAELPHPAPTLGNHAHACEGIRVTDGNRRKPSSDQPIHAIPSQPFPATTTPQRVMPVVTNLKPEAVQRSAVGGHTMVAEETANHRAQPFTLFRNRHMHPLTKFDFHVLKFPTQSLTNRLADHRKHSVTALLGTDMRKP